jgi:2-oxoglutarate ferredoxin oxidoreductase subunit alpha
VLIPEMNLGQLALLIRSRYLIDARSYSKVQGAPIFAEDLEDEIERMLGPDAPRTGGSGGMRDA